MEVEIVPPKKPTLSQLERKTLRRGEASGSELREKLVASVIPPPMEEVLEFVKAQQYLTPNLLAEKFKIRISIAKKVLSNLVERGYLRLVCGDRKLKIYEPIREALVEIKPKKEKVKKK